VVSQRPTAMVHSCGIGRSSLVLGVAWSPRVSTLSVFIQRFEIELPGLEAVENKREMRGWMSGTEFATGWPPRHDVHRIESRVIGGLPPAIRADLSDICIQVLDGALAPASPAVVQNRSEVWRHIPDISATVRKHRRRRHRLVKTTCRRTMTSPRAGPSPRTPAAAGAAVRSAQCRRG
jgi:hypothetical protein